MSAIYTCLDDRKMIHLSQHHFMRVTGNNGIHTFYPRKPLCIFFFNHIGIRHVRANVHQQHHHIHFPFLFKTGRNLNACRIHRIYEINSSNIFRPCLHSRVRSCQSYKSNLYAAAILKWLHHHLARLQPFQWSMVVFCYNISCDIIHAYRCCINQVRQSPVKFMIAYCRHLDIHFPKHLRQRVPARDSGEIAAAEVISHRDNDSILILCFLVQNCLNQFCGSGNIAVFHKCAMKIIE